MADAFLASDTVIRVAEAQKGPRYTTQRIWKLEREALAAAERMEAQGPRPAGELAAGRVIGARPTLKPDQREMVRRLLTDSGGVAVVIGEAGTGKTYAIVAAAEGWAQAGIELRAAAPTWRAANVMRSEGLPAVSIAKLLSQLDRAEHDGGKGLPQGSVLLIDEAGMVDSATLARLISHAERAEAKLVLVGDPEQLSEIEAGGLFRALAERSASRPGSQPRPLHRDRAIAPRPPGIVAPRRRPSTPCGGRALPALDCRRRGAGLRVGREEGEDRAATAPASSEQFN
jgi:ATP-dependent exoDNAse (exonuclease V) alpha subunit